MDNANSPEYLDKIRHQVIENIKRTAFAPSVQMTDVPRSPLIPGMDDEAEDEMNDMDEDDNPDVRYTQHRWDKQVEKDGELSESEDEAENEKQGVRKQPGRKRRMNIMDYQNANAVDGDVTPRPGSANGAGTSNTSAPDTGKSSARASPAAAAQTSASQPASSAQSPTPATGDFEASAAPAADIDSDVDMDNAPEEAATATDVAEAPTAAAATRAAADEPTSALTPPASPPAAAGPAAVAAEEETTTEPEDGQLDPEVKSEAEQPATAPVGAGPAPQRGTTATADTTAEDVDMDDAEPGVQKEEGLKERQEEETRGEAATRAAEGNSS